MSDPKGSFDGHMHYMRLAAERGKEIERLRSIISDCAKSCGATVSVECSLDFMAHLPVEIAAVISILREERDSQQRTCIAVMEELSQLKSRQSGVVLPERSDPEGYSTGSPEWHAAHARNDCLDEVRRLNLAEQLNKASAGVDERAAFYAWFCKRHSYKHGTDTPQLSAAFEPFKAWQARAQLVVPPSAPETSVVVERELLERVERYFSGFVSDEPPAYALGSNGLATIRAILSSKGDV